MTIFTERSQHPAPALAALDSVTTPNAIAAFEISPNEYDHRIELLNSIIITVRTSPAERLRARGLLKRFSTELLEQLDAIAHDPNEKQQSLWSLLCKFLPDNREEELLHIIIRYYPQLTMPDDLKYNYIRHINILRKEDWFPKNPNDDDHSDISVLLNATYSLYTALTEEGEDRSKLGVYDHGERLPVQYIAASGIFVVGGEELYGHLYRNLHVIDRIIDIIVDHKTNDWGTISTLLATAQGTLARGAL